MSTNLRTRPLSQVEVEDRILDLTEAMEARTEDYERLTKAAAEAEADYKLAHGQAVLALIHHQSEKMTAQERTIRADVMTADKHRDYLLTKAARDSCRESLTSLREAISAIRTIAVNVRAMT